MKEGYKETEVGIIPEDWEVKSLGEIFNFSGGLSASREKLSEQGVNYLHYGDIHKRKESLINLSVDKEWLPKLNEPFETLKDGAKLYTGDIVFADASEDYEGIGKSIVVLNENNDDFVAGLHTIVGKGGNDLLNTYYKRYCFSTNDVRKQFRKLAAGTSVYGISRENIKKIKIVMPSLKEQEKIAEILSTVDCQIDDTEKIIEKCRELKKGLMQRLLTKGIGHSEFKKTEVGEIPVGWEVKTIGEICELINGRAFKPQEWREDGIPIIRIQNLNGSEDFNYYEGDIDSKYLVSKDDLLFSWSGSRGTSFGPHIWKGINGALNQHIFKVILKDDTDIEKNFFYYNLKYITTKIEKEAHGSAGLVHITKGALEKIKLVVPELEEQIKISQILYSLDNELQTNIRKRKQLEELKKGLMQQLLTCKIRTI